jgi:hypothetical protein
LLAAAGGCSGGGGGDSGSPPGPQTTADDDFLLTMTAALSEGQLTLNNHWTWQELNLGAEPLYEGANQPPGRVRPYTTLVQEYRVRRKQCEEDFNEFYPPFTYEPPFSGQSFTFRDRKCYPTLADGPAEMIDEPLIWNAISVTAMKRYGWYSGGGFPPVPASDDSRFRPGTPEPLDGVDYCSRLHDEEAWGGPRTLTYHPSECGILMCLYKASGLPANVMALLPDVEVARQHWYDGAASACGGNQPNDAQPPILGP